MADPTPTLLTTLPSGHRVALLSPTAFTAAIPGLAVLLTDAVAGGASVNFLAGVTADEASAWWSERAAAIDDGTITAFVALEPDSGRVVGCTLLVRARQPNGPHRAEVSKVLVHHDARGRGLARALMNALEAHARAEGRWLLHLDTQTGSDAEGMYRALGWHEMGVMPLHSLSVDGVPTAATFFWKDLRG